ncbi:cell death activator CIDE-3 [Chiroxiphia lanceolata]|uniref:cell death activator CIDE-3 n=1 Tax=Chiroxiphia lanceolata TaxID=296741 RepID=UPI0013CF124D|nr:cell death activator CIDE-3 [Chiroxiphia lanceolata]XP_032557048.1 cell death activator CIDE-3 [Chiroxiphia lanceolata]
MDYAKSLSQRLAAPVSRCVSASASMTQQLLASPAPPPRPFRVCNWDRSLRKGIMAPSLAELVKQAQSALAMPGPISLVLDEDGTVVETESFFRTLEEGTVLMALSKGQSWAAPKTPGYQLGLSRKPPRKIDVACVTFDLYKTHPRDPGCLNVKATLYGTYSVSYDLQCYGARRLMKEALRWTLFTMQATGHALLGTSCYMQQLLDATEEQKEEENSLALPNLLPRSLPALPSSLSALPRRKMLQ